MPARNYAVTKVFIARLYAIAAGVECGTQLKGALCSSGCVGMVGFGADGHFHVSPCPFWSAATALIKRIVPFHWKEVFATSDIVSILPCFRGTVDRPLLSK